ncbi:MAG: methionine--tRNA ligase [Gammaproteobacteria bacterium]|nr:methionine--tRNA ligase [Gammaproteobacteria bacterium]
MCQPIILKNSYITTPIYYVNGRPHLGHACTTIVADILKRHRQMQGREVFMTTGTDEHGQKNQISAEAAGINVKNFVTDQSQHFKTLFDAINVDYDFFVRTSFPEHVAGVQAFIQKLYDADALVKKTYFGLYCVGCEQFKKEDDLNDDGQCPDHPTLEIEQMEEENYFLPLEPYRQWLIDRINNPSTWVRPERYRNELLNMLSEPLEDFCVSRPKARVSWGVELPFDSDYVCYVWFDALLNYITSIDWPNAKFDQWWPASEHLIGKDIMKTHCIYWPIMLQAAGVETVNQVSVHGFFVSADGMKMSKTLGNVVDPVEISEHYGVDALRYYLAKNIRAESDSQVSKQLIHDTYQSDLGNKLGNLISRVVKFAAKQWDGKIPTPQSLTEREQTLSNKVLVDVRTAHENLDFVSIAKSLGQIMQVVERLNDYMSEVAPWQLIKDNSQREFTGTVIYTLLDCIRLVLEGLYPIIPESANRGLAVLDQPAVTSTTKKHEFALGRLLADAPLGDDAILFPRVDPIDTQTKVA